MAITAVTTSYMVYYRNDFACDLVPLGTDSYWSTSRLGCIATPSTAATVTTWPTPTTGLTLTLTSATVLFGDGVTSGSVAYLLEVTSSANFESFLSSVGTALTITATSGAADTDIIVACKEDTGCDASTFGTATISTLTISAAITGTLSASPTFKVVVFGFLSPADLATGETLSVTVGASDSSWV